ANSDGEYVGGWRYDAGSKEFVAADLTASKKPFKLSSTTEYTAAQSAASTFVYPVTTGTYTITTSDSNPNYDITFKRDGDTSGVATGKLTITPAKITVNPDSTHGKASVYELNQVGTGKKLEIPAANIVIKGDQTATKTINYADYIFDSNDKKATAPANAPVLDETDGSATKGQYLWQDGKWNDSNLANTAVGSWKGTSGTELTKTAAGSYKAYFKISVPNHEDLVVDWTLTINEKGVSITLRAEKNDKAAATDPDNWVALTGNPVYGDTIRADFDKNAAATAAGVTAASLTNYKIYYKGTDNAGNAYPDVSGVTFDADGYKTDGTTADKSMHQTYGSTTAPKNAGTYTATLVKDGGDYNYTGTTSCSITIDKKKVDKAPADSATNKTYTYNAQDQTFTIKDFDFATMKISGSLPTDMSEVNNSFTTESAMSRQLKAKDAGTYTVKFALKDTDNYEWDTTKVTVNASKEYELKLTIAKAPLKVTFTAPVATETDWTWEPGDYASGSYITYTIDTTTVMPATGTKEDVTVNLMWCEAPASGDAATFDTSTYITTDGLGLDISELGKGNYIVAVYLADDSRGSNVNKNYEIKVDETSKVPTTCKQTFEVTDGTASVKNIGWKVEYTLNGTKYTVDLSTATLSYMLNNDGTPVEYKLVVDGDSLPAYIEVYESYGADKNATGFNTSGYKDATQKNASGTSKYKTVVALKIKDTDDAGNAYEYVFDKNDTKTTGYTYKDDGYCELAVEWTIAKGKLDTGKVVWGYTVAGEKPDENGKPVIHDFRVVNKLDSDGKPIPVMIDDPDNPGSQIQAKDEEGNLLFEKVYETDAQGRNNITPVVKTTGLPASVVTVGTYSGSGTTTANTVNQNQIGSALSSTVSFTLLDTDNFEQPDPITLEWRVTKQTVRVSGWDENGKVTAGDKTYSAPVVKSGDPAVTDAQLADRVEYTYEYNGTTYSISDLWKLADEDLAKGGTGRLQNVKITLKAKDGYQLDASQSNLHTLTTTIGYTGTPITVTADTKTGEYGKAAITLKLEAAGEGDVTNDSTLYEVKVLDKDGKDLGKLGTDVTLSALDAGKYTLKVVTLIDGYTVKAGQDEIEYTITPIEIELPTLEKNPEFDGTEITVTKLLDKTTLDYIQKGIVEVSGEGAEGSGFRDVSDEEGNIITHTLVIKISDKYAGNYKWKGENGETVKPAKFVLVEDIKPETTKISDAEANVEWQVMPLMLTVANSDWNLSGKTPKLNLKSVPSGTEYAVEYKYYTDKNGTEEISGDRKAGSSAWVSAVLTGADVNKCNIKFADSVNGTNGLELATRQSHTVPKGGLASMAGTAVNFLKTNWLWFVIALAVLLFLIILICVIKHRKKTKEAREEKKRKKEEEKERKEEEKRRREEEREAAKAKQQAELELAKAKQEAELAKIRAAAGAAGMAGMAMQQQQPQQQAMPQQQPQMQQPQQMPQPQMQQYPQQQQMPQQMPMMPMQMPMQQQMPQQSSSSGDNSMMMALMQAQLAEMRAQQNAALKTEIEVLKSKLDGRQDSAYHPAEHNPDKDKQGISAELLGDAIIFAISKVVAGKQAAAESEPKLIESESVSLNAPTVYPPDAVVTTTTTVDTTSRQKTSTNSKNASRAQSRRDNRDLPFDIDGFYDAFDENK
ncbi:MAG: hypothetical protein K2G38_01210, partial [Clostridia bacterium]|nr:hypothetical protein [Clostridia bacterium]